MVTTKNQRPHDGGIETIKDRAAHLAQALEKCPLELTLETLAACDKHNSRDTKSRNAKRWIRQFCGFERAESHKNIEVIIQVINEGQIIEDRENLNEIMQGIMDAG